MVRSLNERFYAYLGNVWAGNMLKPSSFFPVSSVDEARTALCRMGKLHLQVRLSTWDQSENSWTADFATGWNYLFDNRTTTVEDLRQAIAGHAVLGKVSILYAT